MKQTSAAMGVLDYRTAKQFDYFAPHKLRGEQPKNKVKRRLVQQGQLGMSTWRKEIITRDGIIRHPTKPQVYGRVLPDGKLEYDR